MDPEGVLQGCPNDKLVSRLKLNKIPCRSESSSEFFCFHPGNLHFLPKMRRFSPDTGKLAGNCGNFRLKTIAM
jgi:hypothetical protein